jgi:predicted DNA-binding transcriptional regulator AlpA
MEPASQTPPRCYGTEVHALIPSPSEGPTHAPMAWRLLSYQDLSKITGYTTRWVRELVRRGELPEPGYLTLDLPRWDPDQVRERLEALNIEWPARYRMRRPSLGRKLSITGAYRLFHVSRTTFFQRRWFREPGKGYGKRTYWTFGQVLGWWEERCQGGREAAFQARLDQHATSRHLNR